MASPILRKGSIGYGACPDMTGARRLLQLSHSVENAGFEAIWVSDHFHPWFHTNASEYSTWVWMAAAMQEIKIPFGTSVTAPILRYHPAIAAQAFATMETLFGHRVMLGVGTGEAMNEVPLGFKWPKYSERRDRLIEAVQVMKKLWRGGFVDFEGKYYRLKAANLYTKADVPVFMSAMGPKMARLAGMYGDGIITVSRTADYAKGTLFPNLRAGAEEANRPYDDITKVVEVDIGYDEDYGRAIKAVRKWAPSLLDEIFMTDISDPREIESRESKVTDKQLSDVFVIATDENEIIRRIEQYFDCGFDHVYVQLNTFDDDKAVELFRTKVLPYFRK